MCIRDSLYTELLTDKDATYTAMQLLLKSNDSYEAAIDQRYHILDLINSEQYSPSIHDLQLKNINEEIKTLNAQASIDRDALIESTRNVIKSFKDKGDIYLGGTAMIASDMISFIKSDLQYFALGVLIMFVITLSIIFKKLRWVAMPLVSSALIAIFVIGFLGWMDWRVTVVSSNFISLLLIISISLTIHLIVRYQELNHKLDLDQKALVNETLRQMFLPCLYTALTTVAAFASLVISDIKPLIDFGLMMVISIASIFILLEDLVYLSLISKSVLFLSFQK